VDVIVYVDLSHAAAWKVFPEDPESVPLGSLPGWQVLNPLLHDAIFKTPSNWERSGPRIVGVSDTYAVVRSPYLAFSSTDDALKSLFPGSGEAWLSRFFDQALPDISRSIARALRYVTKNARLPHEAPSFGMIASHKKIDLVMQFPTPQPSRGAYTNTYELETAITLDRVVEADLIRDLQPPPVVNSLLMDSIQALIESDYRRALLFGAIAMETYAATALEESYQSLLEADLSPNNMRLVSHQLPGGQVQRKDPIYAYLAKRTRTEIRSLLHEVPLYLYGRSLLLDDEALYRRAIRLYKSRNEIVHRGEILEGPESAFAFSRPDADAGVQTALDVCQWFGLSEHYVLPGGELIQIHQPKVANGAVG
jgi:hypothetical protein